MALFHQNDQGLGELEVSDHEDSLDSPGPKGTEAQVIKKKKGHK